MSARSIRLVAVAVVAVVVLGMAGALGLDWIADYVEYRRAIASLAHEEMEPDPSFEEFITYRRAIAFYDAADRVKVGSKAHEVRTILGEPDRVEQLDGEDSWFYSGPSFRGRRQPTIVVDIDRETSRVVALGVINHL